MGDRSAETINIFIAVIAVLALIALGFTLFTITKRGSNNVQDDLVNQIEDISTSLYSDLNNQTITGARVKQAIKQAKNMDCAVLVNTLSLSAASLPVGAANTEVNTIDETGKLVGHNGKLEINNSISTESSLNGALKDDISRAAAPMTLLENFPISTNLGTSVYQPVCVNYGSILRNSIAKAPTASGIISSLYSATGKEWHYGDTDEKINGYGTSCEYSQTLVFDASSNTFRTKLDFATNSETSKVIRYDNTGDIEKKGTSMEISDKAKYDSYVIEDTGGTYIGLIFIQEKA